MWTKQRGETFVAEFAERLAAVKAEKGGKKISAVRVREALELPPSPVMVWTPVQLGAFLDVAAQHRLYSFFPLIAFRGPRRGEGCGVRWEDLDTNERTLVVAKRLAQVGWELEEGEACRRSVCTTYGAAQRRSLMRPSADTRWCPRCCATARRF
ncbi:hypothetical protein ACFSTC_00740 [Nonomuraea ferruginea]